MFLAKVYSSVALHSEHGRKQLWSFRLVVLFQKTIALLMDNQFGKLPSDNAVNTKLFLESPFCWWVDHLTIHVLHAIVVAQARLQRYLYLENIVASFSFCLTIHGCLTTFSNKLNLHCYLVLTKHRFDMPRSCHVGITDLLTYSEESDRVMYINLGLLMLYYIASANNRVWSHQPAILAVFHRNEWSSTVFHLNV